MPLRSSTPKTAALHDVAIVGAGPAGATCAYYLARQGRRVLLLEKETFPRDKYCGDAVCGSAHRHLEEMGVLQSLEADGHGWRIASGGFISPRDVAGFGNSAEVLGRPLVIAVPRIVLDERIARAAQSAGAELVEAAPVEGAEFDEPSKTWTIHCRSGAHRSFRARVLVAADGAMSRLARSIGLLHTAPDGVCSRAYMPVENVQFAHDGVLFYRSELLPGCCSLMRVSKTQVSYCCYILPGGERTTKDLPEMHRRMLREIPAIARAVGPDPKVGPLRGAPLRLGGIARSYADHFLVLGDAAGQIDPLTGEGIHYAMDAAEAAAQTLAEAFAKNDFSGQFLRRYHHRWMHRFGSDFRWSWCFARIVTRFPFVLDALAETARRRGPAFLTEWGKIMTGLKPKSHLLHPRMALPAARDIFALLAHRTFRGRSLTVRKAACAEQ